MAKKTPEEIEREVERICREIKYEGFMKSRTWKNIGYSVFHVEHSSVHCIQKSD